MSEGNKVFVGKLAWKAEDQDLYDVFGRYGKIEEVHIVKERDTGKSKGFGFVTFGSSSEAQDAINGANGAEICGREITVDEAKPKSNSGGGGGGGYRGGRGGGGRGGGGYGGGGRSYGGGGGGYGGGGGGYGGGGRSYGGGGGGGGGRY